MKRPLFLLLAGFLMLSGFAFAATEMDDSDVEVRGVHPGYRIPNCGSSGPSIVSFEIWIINPYGESETATFYYMDQETGGWVEIGECSVSAYGSVCGDNEDLEVPLQFGGEPEETLDGVEVLKFELGDDYYYIIELDNLTHYPSSSESQAIEDADELEALYSGLEGGDYCTTSGACCPFDVESLSGKAGSARTFLSQCKVSSATNLLGPALEDAREYSEGKAACEAAVKKIDGVLKVKSDRSCSSPTVDAAISSLESDLEAGDYDVSLSVVNAAMENECGGELPEELPTVEKETGNPGSGSLEGGGGDEGFDPFNRPVPEEKKVCCVSLLILLAPLVARWAY